MDRTAKETFIQDFKKTLKDVEVMIVTHHHGLSVAEATDLRNKMRDADAEYKVVKNTLARIALKGTNFEDISSYLQGPTALAYSKDPVAAAKIAVDFSKDNEKLSVVSGVLGRKTLDLLGIQALASLPSLDQLRAKILGVISTPTQKMVSVFNAPASQLTQVISAYAKKG